MEAYGQEEWLRASLVQLLTYTVCGEVGERLDGVLCDLCVWQRRRLLRCFTDGDPRVTTSIASGLADLPAPVVEVGRVEIWLRPREWSVVVPAAGMPGMEDLARATRQVAVLAEQLRNGRVVATHSSKVREEIPHPGGIGVAACQQAGPCRRADGLLDLCLAKKQRSGNDLIHVGCAHRRGAWHMGHAKLHTQIVRRQE